MKTRIERSPDDGPFAGWIRYRFELSDGRIYAVVIAPGSRVFPIERSELAGFIRATRADLRLLESQAATKH